MSQIQLIIAGVFVFFGTGCLQTLKLTPEVTSEWGNVAVVSTAASKLNFAFVGTTAFNNSYVSKDLENDEIDRMITNDVVQILSSQGIKALPSSSIRQLVLESSGDSYYRSKIDFGRISSELGANNTFTHLAVLKGGRHAPAAYLGDPIGGSNQSLYGIGLYQRSLLGITDGAYFYAVASVQLYDLKTGKKVAGGTDLQFVKTNLVAFPKNEDEVKAEKTTLFLKQNYNIILEAFENATGNLF